MAAFVISQFNHIAYKFSPVIIKHTDCIVHLKISKDPLGVQPKILILKKKPDTISCVSRFSPQSWDILRLTQ